MIIANLKHDIKVNPDGTASQRDFLFVDKAAVVRTEVTFSTMKGTRNFHCVSAEAGIRRDIRTRELSCYCGQDPCKNQGYVENWSNSTVKSPHPESVFTSAAAPKPQPAQQHRKVRQPQEHYTPT